MASLASFGSTRHQAPAPGASGDSQCKLSPGRLLARALPACHGAASLSAACGCVSGVQVRPADAAQQSPATVPRRVRTAPWDLSAHEPRAQPNLRDPAPSACTLRSWPPGSRGPKLAQCVHAAVVTEVLTEAQLRGRVHVCCVSQMASRLVRTYVHLQAPPFHSRAKVCYVMSSRLNHLLGHAFRRQRPRTRSTPYQ